MLLNSSKKKDDMADSFIQGACYFYKKQLCIEKPTVVKKAAVKKVAVETPVVETVVVETISI